MKSPSYNSLKTDFFILFYMSASTKVSIFLKNKSGLNTQGFIDILFLYGYHLNLKILEIYYWCSRYMISLFQHLKLICHWTALWYIYIIITVTWSEEPDYVQLTGVDRQIKWDVKHQIWSDNPPLSVRRGNPHLGSCSCYNDKFIIY